MAAPDQSDTAPPFSPTDPTDPTGPFTGPPGVPPPPPVPPPTEEPVAEPTSRPEATDPPPTPAAEDPLGPPPGPATSVGSATAVPSGPDGPGAVEDPLGPPADPASTAELAWASEEGKVPATGDTVVVPLADGTAEPATPGLETQPNGKTSRLDVNGTQLCASTLASVSAAVVSSVFGVTGTVIGAAVGSVLATTGTAFYSHGLRQTTAKLQQTQVVQLSRWSRIWAGGRTTETRSTSRSTTTVGPAAPGAVSTSGTAAGPDADDSDRPAWKDWLAEHRWGPAVGVVIVFVASMVAITAFELVGQGPLASATGNDPAGSTSIGSLFDADNDSDKDDGLDPTEGEQAPGDTETTLAPDDPAADDGTTDDGSSDTPTTSVDGSDTGDDPTVTEPAADPGTDPGVDTGTATG